jgi:hypothetical protein
MEQGTVNLRRSKGPGRPRKTGPGRMTSTASSQAHQPEVVAPGGVTRRLLDLDAAATYLSVSPWTVRDLEAAGVLARVRVPLPKGGELRKLLFDKADLDRLIGAWKEAAG